MTGRSRSVLRVLGMIAAAVVVICVIILAWPAPRVPGSLPEEEATPDLVLRGKYMATAADCVACHTTKGGTPFAGGRPFRLPFGTIYAPNITPDRETGIGQYSDGEFLRAMHDGVGRDGKQLYPAFPYTSYSMLTDVDVRAIKAYLFSLAPVRQATPSNELSFPFDQRRFVRFWNLLFLRDRDLAADHDRTPEWNRGAYLVKAAGHCGECHTPRNLLYAATGEPLSGETMQGWTAWNITSDPAHGIGKWSEQELVHYMREGFAPGRAVASGPMKEAVMHSLSRLNDADLRSIAVYLKSVPAVAAGPVPRTTIDSSTAAKGSSAVDAGAETTVSNDLQALGRRVFDGACASCHALSGGGQQTPLAALRGLRSVSDAAGMNVMQIVLHGEPPLSSAEQAFMPAFRAAYSDEELAAVSTFVRSHFGGQSKALTPADIRSVASSAQ